MADMVAAFLAGRYLAPGPDGPRGEVPGPPAALENARREVNIEDFVSKNDGFCIKSDGFCVEKWRILYRKWRILYRKCKRMRSDKASKNRAVRQEAVRVPTAISDFAPGSLTLPLVVS